jgi:DNA repair protein RadC
MENTNQYLLSNDEEIINTFIKGLQEINITTFEQLRLECKARNITTFTDFFELPEVMKLQKRCL